MGRLPAAAIVALFFAVLFAGYYNFFVGFLYERGAPVADAGRFAFAIYRNAPSLPLPAIFGGDSYFGSHFRPAFLLADGLSYLVSDPPGLYFCLFQAFTYASCAACLLLALFLATPAWSARLMFVPLVVAMMVDGWTMPSLQSPHPEYGGVGSVVLGVVLVYRRHFLWGCLVILFGAMWREDLGLLGATLLLPGLVTALRARRPGEPSSGDAMRYAVVVAVLCLSFVLGLAGISLFSDDGSIPVLRGTVTGRQPFAHLTLSRFAEIGLSYLTHPHHLFLLLAPAIVFWRYRLRLPLAMLAALAPWFLVSLLSEQKAQALMWMYKPFQLNAGVIAATVTAAMLLFGRSARQGRAFTLSMTALFAASLVLMNITTLSAIPSTRHLAEAFLRNPFSLRREALALEGDAHALLAASPKLTCNYPVAVFLGSACRSVILDQSWSNAENISYCALQPDGGLRCGRYEPAQLPPDLRVLSLDGEPEHKWNIAGSMLLSRGLAVQRLIANSRLLLFATPGDAPMPGFASIDPVAMLNVAGPDTGIAPDGRILLSPAADFRRVLSGPDFDLRPGAYEARFAICTTAAGTVDATLAVAGRWQFGRTLAETAASFTAAAGECRDVAIAFRLGADTEFDHRLSIRAQVPVSVGNYRIARRGP